MTDAPYRYFRIEARHLINGLSREAMHLEQGCDGAEPVPRMLRLAHTLKGAGRLVKQPEISISWPRVRRNLATTLERGKAELAQARDLAE